MHRQGTCVRQFRIKIIHYRKTGIISGRFNAFNNKAEEKDCTYQGISSSRQYDYKCKFVLPEHFAFQIYVIGGKSKSGTKRKSHKNSGLEVNINRSHISHHLLPIRAFMGNHFRHIKRSVDAYTFCSRESNLKVFTLILRNQRVIVDSIG